MTEPADDTTLGGYIRAHGRPPAFEGPDGHPYSVSIEAEQTADLRTPWEGFLVFPRWAATGLGIIGHVETPTLWRAQTREALQALAEATALFEVQAHLDAAIAHARSDADPS